MAKQQKSVNRSIYRGMRMARPRYALAFAVVYAFVAIYLIPAVALYRMTRFTVRFIVAYTRNLSKAHSQPKRTQNTYDALKTIDPDLASRHLHDKLRRSEANRDQAIAKMLAK